MRLDRSALPAALAIAAVAACGARTGLPLSEATQAASSKFCARGAYESGHTDVTLLVLLDRSSSMGYDRKWDDATAAVASFVRDPEAAGMGFGLAYFPSRYDECSLASYELPAVGVDVLPNHADKVIDSLSRQKPEGVTPTWLALRGAVQHARALRTAEPTRAAVIAIVTDGDPAGCRDLPNDLRGVVDLAAEAAGADPQVRTFVIGFETGFVERSNQIAAAGGSGKAIVITTDPTTAQQIVTTLKSVRDDARACRYGVPAVAAPVTAYDVGVVLTPSPGATPVPLALAGGAARCGDAPAFFVDDPAKPARFTLCPAACALAHADPRSRVDVTLGCGAGAPDGGVVDFDAGPCPGAVDAFCKTSCDTTTFVDAVCRDGRWTCPPGSVSTASCSICPAVLHGCCRADRTVGEASCVAGAWVCPPGATAFGSAGCAPPGTCAPAMPCALGSVCRAPDAACGARALGACVPRPATCPAGAPACGCDGKVYASECAANQAGVDVSAQGCEPPSPAHFACGPYFCRRADELCRRTIDTRASPATTSFACAPAAGCTTGCGCGVCGACARPSCVEGCASDGSGGRTVTCTLL
jgi:Mg-chelatase subunit ChlD